jgi:cell shape-determining protein MreC
MFIFLQNGELINTKYIKKITPDMIYIANTEHVAIAVTKNCYDSKVQRTKDDIKIQITNEEYKSIREQLEYPQKMALLEAENKQLKLEIMYRPGGPGFDMAHNDFNSMYRTHQ